LRRRSKPSSARITVAFSSMATVAEQSERFLAELANRKRRPVKPATLKVYGGFLRNWIVPNLGFLRGKIQAAMASDQKGRRFMYSTSKPRAGKMPRLATLETIESHNRCQRTDDDTRRADRKATEKEIRMAKPRSRNMAPSKPELCWATISSGRIISVFALRCELI
jgi:hypothetical protein